MKGITLLQNVTAPDSPLNDKFLDPFIEGDITAFLTAYQDLLGPIAAVLILLPPAAAYSVQSDTQTMPLVLFILSVGVLGSIAIPGSVIQGAVVIALLGVAFVGIKIYMESGRNSR